MLETRNFETPEIVEHMLEDGQMEIWMGHPSRLYLTKIVDHALTQYKAKAMKDRHNQMKEVGL